MKSRKCYDQPHCFAYHNGNCVCLSDVDPDIIPCPFYKDEKKVDAITKKLIAAQIAVDENKSRSRKDKKK